VAYGTSGGELVMVLALGFLFGDAAGSQYPAACSAEAALVFSAAVLVLGRPAGADVALVMSNPGVEDCVSNQCDAATLARACSKCMVARFGVEKPGKGPGVSTPSSTTLCGACLGTVHVCRDAKLRLTTSMAVRPRPRVLTECGKVMADGGGSRK
jgi:hypothetical protein